ncbi:hypothetical protein BH09SUM1_BH09SUM1_08010 [soil metagenome]
MAASIAEQLAQLEREFEARRVDLFEPARKRLDEIARMREDLDREEGELYEVIGESRGGPPKKQRKQRATGGKRMGAAHKKEIVGRFISKGHIKNNTDLSRELRIALEDEGLRSYDFRKMNEYLPSGWSARSNGQRGLLAKTTFHQG